MRNKFYSALSLAVIASMLITSLALADNVQNDVVAGGNDTILVGGTTTINYRITANSGDGQAGCNAADSSPATVTINTPAGVTVDTSGAPGNQATLTFTSCGTNQSATFSSNASGNYPITVSVSDSGAGTYNVNPAAFTLHVNAPPPPANTAPSVSVTGVSNGGIYNKGSVPVAMCDVTDAEDNPADFAAALSPISGPYASDGIGSQTATCSYTDAGGLNASASATYSIVDPSAPVIGYTLNPASPDGSNGWYKGSVTLTWNVSEPESPNSLQKTGCEDQNITADQAETSYSCSASSAGGSAGLVTVNIKRDGTAPNVTVTPARAADAAGWYNAPVAFDTAGTDAPSDVNDANCTADQNYTGPDGSGLTLNGSCTDNAGNAGNGTSASFNFDDTNPSLSWNGSINNGDSFYFGSVPAAPTCSAADATSGPGSCAVTGYATTVGTHTLTATAYDIAGNSYTETRSYTVLAWTINGFYQPTDMGSTIWNTVRNGSTVPLKFEVFAGSTELTSTSIVNQPLRATQTLCSGGSTDDIELLSSGATSLRYDATSGQFIYNWQTPRKAGYCYVVTVTTADGTSISANFKLK